MTKPTRLVIEGDAATAVPYIALAKRLLKRFTAQLPAGGFRYLDLGDIKMRLLWTPWIDKIRIEAGGIKLAFGLHPDTGDGIVARYSGPDVPATLVRLETAPIRLWSKDGRVGLDITPIDATDVYREGTYFITLPRIGIISVFPGNFVSGAFANPTSGYVASDGSVIVSPDVSTTVPGAFTAAKFAVFRPDVFDNSVPPVLITPAFYEEIDPGIPDIAGMSTFATYDSLRRWFYVSVTSIPLAAALRITTTGASFGGGNNVDVTLYGNPYDASEIYLVVSATLITSLVETNGANSRAWELEMHNERKLFRYRLTIDGDGLYQSGSWVEVYSLTTPDVKRTIIDQSWAFGGLAESETSTAPTIDGAKVLKIPPPLGEPFPVSAVRGIDYVEPWFRTSGAMEVARHESVALAAFNQTVTNPYQLDDSPLLNIIRYGNPAYGELATQRILLDAVEFATGLGLAELPGDPVASLKHLGLGQRALLIRNAGATPLAWIHLSSTPIDFASFPPTLLSVDGDRLYFTDFWLAGNNVAAIPVGNTVVSPSFDDNAEVWLDVAAPKRRLASFSPAGALTLGDFIPNKITGVTTLFNDPIALTPALAQVTVKRTVP